jgi:hypothetical protein
MVSFTATMGCCAFVTVAVVLSTLWGKTILPPELWPALLFPLSLWLRGLGIRHLHFKEHEESLNHLGEQYPGSKKIKETIKQAQTFQTRIDGASGWERQKIRQETKHWLENLAPENLDPATADYCQTLFGYLLPDTWKQKREGHKPPLNVREAYDQTK